MNDSLDFIPCGSPHSPCGPFSTGSPSPFALHPKGLLCQENPTTGILQDSSTDKRALNLRFYRALCRDGGPWETRACQPGGQEPCGLGLSLFPSLSLSGPGPPCLSQVIHRICCDFPSRCHRSASSLWKGLSSPYFGAQKGKFTCQRSHSKETTEPRFEIRGISSRVSLST